MPMFKPRKPYELYDEDKGRFNKDSEFLDGLIEEHISMGGVPIYVYRLKGIFDQKTDALGVEVEQGVTEGVSFGTFMNLQDTVLGENRDREYDMDEIIRLKAVYQISQNELEYAKFGLVGLTNNVLTLEIHLQTCENLLGRRLIPGDVVEMPHLREVGVDGRVGNAWYEVASVVKSPAGFDPMFGFHVLGVIVRPMRDAQEFLDILERKDEYGKTLQEQLSNRENMEQITAYNQVLAEQHAPTTMYDTSLMYFDPADSKLVPNPFTDDAVPPNGIPVRTGTSFPEDVQELDYFVRTDLLPNRLYQYSSGRWHVREVDRKREWQPYNWVAKLREFMSDGSAEDAARGYKLRSLHDAVTDRQERSKPTLDADDD